MRSEVAMPLRRVPAIANCADDDMPTTSVNQESVKSKRESTADHVPQPNMLSLSST